MPPSFPSLSSPLDRILTDLASRDWPVALTAADDLLSSISRAGGPECRRALRLVCDLLRAPYAFGDGAAGNLVECLRDESRTPQQLFVVEMFDLNIAGARLNYPGIDFTDARLVGANLNGVVLDQQKIVGANLTGAMLNESFCRAVLFDRGAAPGASFVRADFETSRFTGGFKAEGANFTDAILQDTVLVAVKFAGATLVKANLQHARLTGVDLSGANLTGANLWGTTLQDVDLRGANLTGVQLRGDEIWRGVGLEGAIGADRIDVAVQP
ncbi:pentapeptide repeat-containing protein [Mycobacteroides abscessus subsp. abscessus]|jgi:uncharacterized protein YjbI with pentapeptide repeats|uniref:pentapeptide repeat-containing protein n=1 Tax=Mycobacteroides abscessus TaxID=36809 RepID=UPI00266D3F7A|nr:pentapeptide repeat-containing protein [Mycobacteroides abscessus]MDO3014633.1 pentapeptide repeat-containing protein [Mycobacteroides abscessus subsp. abscessus]